MHRPPTLIAALLLACTPAPAPGRGTGSTGTTTTTTDIPTTGVPGGTASAADVSTTSPTSSASPGDDHEFIARPDVPPPGFPRCDLARPDCPDGFKCNPSGVGSDSVFTGSPQCVPLVRGARPAGEPCTVFDDPLDGTDDCDAGVVCLFPDADGEGQCHALCAVSDDGPACAEPLTCSGHLCQSCFWGYCDAVCDPRVLTACEPGDLCINATSHWWTCIADASGDAGQAGDPCQFIDQCDPGHLCTNADQVIGCADATGCCAPVCSTDQANTCPGAAQGEQCVSWYASGQGPPPLDTLGVCAVPL